MSCLFPPKGAAYYSLCVPMHAPEYVYFYLTDVNCFLVSLLTVYYAICDYKKSGVRQQGRSGCFLHPGCCILGQVGPPEKQGEILPCCGKEMLWSPALMCWSLWSSDPSQGEEVKPRTRAAKTSVRSLLGSIAPQTVRLDEYLCLSKGGDGNEAVLTWIDLSQHRSASWDALPGREGWVGAGSQPSFRGDRREMFPQGNVWSLPQFRNTEFGAGVKLERSSPLQGQRRI